MWCCALQSPIYPKNGENWLELDQKYSFLKLLENLVISLFLNLVYKEILYYLLYYCTNSILKENPIPEISAIMLSVVYISRKNQRKSLRTLKLAGSGEKISGIN